MMHKKIENRDGWLLFFYSVPSKPVGFRVKIWRKLAKAGALSMKGAVYVLPDNEDNFEYFQWLVSEIESGGGEAAFVKVEKVETMKNFEIVDLFDQARKRDYRNIEKPLGEIERKVGSIKKEGNVPRDKKVPEQFRRLTREFEEIRRRDFFGSKLGGDLNKRIKAVESGIKRMTIPNMKEENVGIVSRNIEDYKGKIWVTRKNPFVDRMASAWLIKKFIDKDAIFKFMDEKMIQKLGKGRIAFDVRGGEFTHIGDMCTFEVMMKCFRIEDRNVKKIAEIVHELDVKDESFHKLESRGIESILAGIRKKARSDKEMLEEGMAIFEMLYPEAKF